MLVSGGRVASVITSQLSKPTIATSSGTSMPRLAQRVERAARDLVVAAEQRVGRRRVASNSVCHGFAAPGFRPAARQIRPVASASRLRRSAAR